MREKETILSLKPQVSLSLSTPGRMWLISACAALAVVQSAMTDSCSSLVIALAALSAAVLTEALIFFRTARPVPLGDGSAVASALILTLLLPNRIHPVYAAAGAVFATAVIKHSFGGLGSNWLNPAAGGWLFVRFSWPEVFRRSLEDSPLTFLAENPGLPVSAALDAAGSPAVQPLRSFLNGSIFSFSGSVLPGGYLDLFFASPPGIIADRGMGGLLLGTVIIIAFRIYRSWVPALYLGIYGILVRTFGALPFGGGWRQGDVLFGLCTGGTLAAAFLLSGDPATGAKSNPGMALVTAVAALLGFLCRYTGGEPYGVFLTVLLLNALVPLVRDLESRRLYKRPENHEQRRSP
jgi:electron transport complex protein RnfD